MSQHSTPRDTWNTHRASTSYMVVVLALGLVATLAGWPGLTVVMVSFGLVSAAFIVTVERAALVSRQVQVGLGSTVGQNPTVARAGKHVATAA